MVSGMKVLIVGGTGTLGRQIAKKAIDAGMKVRCMVRRPRKASYLQEWGCELTQGDLLNKKDILLTYNCVVPKNPSCLNKFIVF